MSVAAAVRLVKSLSGSEKRFFKLNTRQQTGNKAYCYLFDQITSCGNDITLLENRFNDKYPKRSIDNTARYLVQVLTDCLIQLRIQKDPAFQMHQGILRAKVLQERSLTEAGMQELIQVRKLAQTGQQPLMEYLSFRYELDYLSDSGFKGISDRSLVEMQMKAREVLKGMNHVQDHHSLFEMMKYRLLYSGQILSDTDRKQLNDLMLSEMILMAGKMKNNFTTKKLHLLFQSYFLSNLGDFSSALGTYRELNQLFEDNISLLDHPPLDYLSTLDGILSSLRMLRKYQEITYYVGKLRQLDLQTYPEYFRYQLRKSILIAELASNIARKQYPQAVAAITAADPDLLSAYDQLNEEKQWELYFYCSLAYFSTGNWKKAHAYIALIMNRYKAQPLLLICKATRLLNMVVYYEQGEAGHLDYEIRSYSRFFGKAPRPLLKTELLLLKYLQLKPDKNRKKLPAAQQKKIQQLVDQVRQDRYEEQLLHYFDFADWIEKQIQLRPDNPPQ